MPGDEADHAEQQRHLPFGEGDVREQVRFGVDRAGVQLGAVAGGEGARSCASRPGSGSIRTRVTRP